jgi:hypothetical protein
MNYPYLRYHTKEKENSDPITYYLIKLLDKSEGKIYSGFHILFGFSNSM